MEKVTMAKDLFILTSRAPSFPDRIGEAFTTLENNLGNEACDRVFYGLSRPEKGEIVYWAGIEAKNQEEGKKYNLPLVILKRGVYLCENIRDWKKNVQLIGQTFRNLIEEPEIDPLSYCVEVYGEGSEMTCMVRLKDAE